MPVGLLPLHTIPVEDAVTRCFNGTCHVVSEYDVPIKTQRLKMRWPSVIARNGSGYREPIVKLTPETLYYRDHGICVYCEQPLAIKDVTYDHYIPKTRGGDRSWENIVCACKHCNNTKSDAEPVGVWEPKHKPYRPKYYELLERRKNYPIVVDDEAWIHHLPNWQSEVIIRNF